MTTKHCSILAKVAACTLLFTSTGTATAQIGVTKNQERWIVVGIAAVGAGIGIGVFYAIHHGYSLSGCAVSGANGLELQNRGNQQTYALVGQVADIKPGDWVRVSGKKKKKSAGTPQEFLVEKLSRDYGSCRLKPQCVEHS
jgi:hypothetical protein